MILVEILNREKGYYFGIFSWDKIFLYCKFFKSKNLVDFIIIILGVKILLY